MKPDAAHFDGDRELKSAKSPLASVVVFIISSVVLFLGMSTMPSIYDEGITLTGAMRVAAGQIPHGDFHANYGPLHFYLLALLFKIFGETLLVERILYTMICGAIVTLTYAIASRYRSTMVSVWTALTITFWLFGLGAVSGYVVYPVSIVALIAAALMVSVFVRRMSAGRALTVGVLAGLAGLLRYDTGVTLLGVQICVLFWAASLRSRSVAMWVRVFFASIWPVLAGFAIPVVPAFLYYESRAPFHYFYLDVIDYARRYYVRGRSLPFPAVHPKNFQDIGLYLPVVIAVIAIVYGVMGTSRVRRGPDFEPVTPRRSELRAGFLVVFGALTLAMYLKGIVRVAGSQMYLAIPPALLCIAVLFDARAAFRRPMAVVLSCLAILSVSTGAFAAAVQAHHFNLQHTWLPIELLARARGRLSPEEAAWCKTTNPLTTGICFIPQSDHIKAIEFIDSHTAPGQTLFVGQPHSDRMFANDNLTYFATQRLPATHWHHFDPFLQNRRDIQLQMIQDLDRNQPPYIMLDSEFEDIHEPNESDKSSGVTLLDDYIHSRYRPVVTYGKLAIWKQAQP
jgi:hypothetical protein